LERVLIHAAASGGSLAPIVSFFTQEHTVFFSVYQFSIAHQIHLVLRAGSLPLDDVATSANRNAKLISLRAHN
jgi:hypothetical protein